ncbi:MAG: hypothetical protein VR65_02945 [Desulfobulbaceae bacterium BRH_c16a]|nr:MAG: hypothetical protein VR65_02945 [Desulfobulbaceae bacterium BRH_c16a]
MATLGVEIEMPVIRKETGSLHLVDSYFRSLERIKRNQGEEACVTQVDGRDLAVLSPGIVSSVDNGFNNLESAIGPIPDTPNNLEILNRTINRELHDVITALADEKATILNLSQHPSTVIDQSYYLSARSPKPIYDYWVQCRKWNHMAGIDAKAHNGPTTGVSFFEAIEGLNLLLALSPVFIALYANSPFAGGRTNGIKENRLTLWPSMFKPSRFACDRKLHRMPDRPFADLKEYFNWMYGQGTNMQCIFGQGGSDYKKTRDLLCVKGHPGLIDFLRKERWPVKTWNNGKTRDSGCTVQPNMRYFEFLQFSHFLDVRIRFQFKEETLPVELFLETLDSDRPLEDVFENYALSSYLEGRAAGTNFADRQLVALNDRDIARSVVISVSALQLGLLRNRAKAWKIVQKHGWAVLSGSREAAIRDGLQGTHAGVSIHRLCREAVEAVASELTLDEQWMLAYPLHVLDTGENGADRALAAYDQASGSPAERLQRVIRHRQIVDLAQSAA